VSSKEGQAALIDGASAQVVATVAVSAGDADLNAAQGNGLDAYVADAVTGTVRRIDGATYRVSRPAQLPPAGSG
jgi:hypothetical protein